MSENEIKRDLSRYDALTTEELEQILLADMLITDEDDKYLEMIVYVSEVYAQRKKSESASEPEAKSNANQPFLQRFIRPIAAAAAIVALVFFGTMTAKSMGYDLWGAVAKWTSSVFTLASMETTPSDADPLETIERMKPKWLPEGFELMHETFETDVQIKYHASYEKDGKTINFTYQNIVSNNTDYLEKSEDDVEVYEKNGITFYIFKNIERIVTVWYTDGLTCHIGGDISVNEMKKVIDSIGQS